MNSLGILQTTIQIEASRSTKIEKKKSITSSDSGSWLLEPAHIVLW